MKADAPERGDLIWLDFSPQVGHEQTGRRPALVISNRAFNDRLGLAFVCPITSRVRGVGTEVLLPEDLPIKGAVLVAHLRSIDWRARSVETVGTAPADVVDELAAKLILIIH